MSKNTNTNVSLPLLMMLGITEQSARILILLISDGPQTVTTLAKKLSLSRTTLYEYLSELTTKDLCKKQDNSQKYEHLSLHLLSTKIEESSLLAHETLNDLITKTTLKEKIPEIQVHTGKEAIGLVYKDLALSLPKGGTYYRYTSRKEDFKRDPTYKEQRLKKEFERLVITSAEKAETKPHDANRFIKTVPKGFSFDDNVTLVIYGDTVAHLDHTTETAITITSPIIARFQEKIFKLLWKRL